MHFHGTSVRKPIPSYHVYKGTVFQLVEQAVDFVMSKLNRSVGLREHGPEAPVEYEIPQPVVAEAIVNAVAHRDYTSNASVQVMLFSDRLEVWNPGQLPPPLTLEMLRQVHPSIPANPLLAEPLFLTKYIEKAGSGTLDMIALCEQAGLPAPQFKLEAGCFIIVIQRSSKAISRDIEQVGAQVGTKLGLSRDQVEILHKCIKDSGITDLMQISERTNRTKFRNQVLNPLLEEGLVEMTIPDKPTSSKQQYRLTKKGRLILDKLKAW